jgi:hypothetical protein
VTASLAYCRKQVGIIHDRLLTGINFVDVPSCTACACRKQQSVQNCSLASASSHYPPPI